MTEKSARDQAADARLLRAATELLGLIGEALRERGHAVTWDPALALHGRGIGRPPGDALNVDGVAVPLIFSEYTSGSYFGSYSHERARSGRLEVRCDWVWNMDAGPGPNVKLKSKTFAWSKTRATTHGFDVPKIVDHVELWVQTERKTTKLSTTQRLFEAQWKSAADRLRKLFPEHASCIDSDATGIHLDLRLGEGQAESVLKALSRKPTA